MAHGKKHYIKIYWILLVLLVVSIIGPEIAAAMELTGMARNAVVLPTAFGIAIVKAYLVAKHFMHINLDHKYVTYLLTTMLAFMFLFFTAVAPDVMKHEGQNWENRASKEYVKAKLAEEAEGKPAPATPAPEPAKQ